MVKSTSSSQFKIDPLLKAIRGSDPCGEYLRYTAVYDKIREARREEDQHLPQGIWKSKVKRADWDTVRKLCEDALKTRSKDLQIAAWLTESLLYLQNLGGVHEGLRLILELTHQYWDGLYPRIDEKGIDHRLVPFEWLNSKLGEELQDIYISKPTVREIPPVTMLEYQERKRKRSVRDGVEDPSDSEDKLSPSTITASINETPVAFYETLTQHCTSTLDLIVVLEKELEKHLEGDAPRLYRLKEKIQSIQSLSEQILAERGKVKSKDKKDMPKISSPKSAKHFSGSIDNRERAYEMLGEIATYLEQIEPHSPTPYLIRRAISWGEMNLSQVFADTLRRDQDLSLLLEIMDIKKAEQEEEQVQ